MSDGLPIVWVPGHLCGPWLYAPQLAAFGETHPTVIADVSRDDRIDAMAERLLDGAPERFVLAGLSMGGMVAMEVMARAPDRVAGAMLMDTDPTAARPKEREWRKGLLSALRNRGTAAYAGRFTPKFFGHDAEAEASLGHFVLAMAAETPPRMVRAQARALDRRRDMIEGLAGFAAPVEIVVGAEDRVCPPRLHAAIVSACADAIYTEIPGAGHLVTLEAPDAVNARMSALLERIGGRQGAA